MTIAPVRRTIVVKAPPERAFAAFTRDMGRWWPRGRTIGAQPHADVVMEPRPGGRWFERADDGSETDWGRVLAWEPPARLLLAWQIDARFRYDPQLVTELELTFDAGEDGSTRVTLEHRNMERFGDSAQAIADKLGGGWPSHLERFAEFAARAGGGPAEPGESSR